jgi:biopolymer transport protein ExbB
MVLGVIIERFIAYRRARCKIEMLKSDLESLIIGNKIEEALFICKKTRGLIPKIFYTGLQSIIHAGTNGRSKNEIEIAKNAITEILQVSTLPYLERDLNVLDTLARGTPLLGLLGTVLGMIKVFFIVGGGNIGDPEKMAQGIAWALMTTAAGLLVAIPAFFAHRHFIGQVESLLIDIQKNQIWLFNQLTKRALILEESGEKDG